ncbi:transmembrane protein [Achlya hypogyna]|uniref:Transmembrane protein n=1 Tax=Achlya hypogyna TaxID=1202772 RepID=A0A1V9YI11_ACHHY|nr:transmembrane protein [Achlya hypogyna]
MMLQTTKQLAKAAKAQAPAHARMVSYTERQARLGRPVSPHVEIYAFPVTAIASITNRATGVALTGGFASAAFVSLLGADVPALIYAAQEVIPFFAPLSKFCVAFPVTYHSLNAVRGAVWSKRPELLETVNASQSSYGLLGASAVVGIGAACYTIKRD